VTSSRGARKRQADNSQNNPFIVSSSIAKKHNHTLCVLRDIYIGLISLIQPPFEITDILSWLQKLDNVYGGITQSQSDSSDSGGRCRNNTSGCSRLRLIFKI